MKKPLISRESIKLMFELGIEVLKSMKDIYETKTEERILIKDDNTTEDSNRSSKENPDTHN
jgi:hypothetical protein